MKTKEQGRETLPKIATTVWLHQTRHETKKRHYLSHAFAAIFWISAASFLIAR